MMKRRTIEIIVETEERLMVDPRNQAISLECPECGALVESHSQTPNGLLHQNGEANVVLENPQIDTFRRIARLRE